MFFDSETMFAAQYVVGRRVGMMWSDLLLPTPQARREVDRMVTEKIVAAAEGAAMMPSAVIASVLTTTGACRNGAPFPVALFSGFDAAARAILSPARRRVRANAKRLTPAG